MKNKILEAYNIYKSFAEVGRKFGISKQRVHQLVTGYRSDDSLSGRDRTRELVRKRDNHQCQDCGEKWIKSKRKLDVHHLFDKNGSKSLKYDKVSTLHELITLCHRCHMKRHLCK